MLMYMILHRRVCFPLIGLGLLFLSACDSNQEAYQCDVEFRIEDVVEGDGVRAEAGKLAVVQYEGYLCDPSAPDLKGSRIDTSGDGEPYAFIVGAGSVIEGWERGVEGMRVGGRRTLTIPPDMAYGERGVEDVIPPNATLIYDVELIDVQ